ncbi:MAG TPA: hypothetical protein VGO43_09210 [Pyrinomonadaceae bacterium]|jgi:hypothetical protein|nr:hypothetical protein [Pyrinomonadaceae bacterium]
MRKLSTLLLALGVVSIALFAAGCPQQRKIADIERNPGRYQDKEVVVVGVVRDSYGFGIPGTNIGGGAYKIDDGTGSIWVLVTDGNVPSKGAEVGVRGTVGSGVNWKGRNYGLGIYEKERKYKKR